MIESKNDASKNLEKALQALQQMCIRDRPRSFCAVLIVFEIKKGSGLSVKIIAT